MDKVLNESLTRYFNVLSKLGYMSYSEVDKLLVLIFIYESDCKSFITEKENRILDSALYCLYGTTCLIPYPEYIANTSISCTGKSV